MNKRSRSRSHKPLKTGELANLIGVTSQMIRIYIKNNEIPYHISPVSGRYMFTKEDVDEIYKKFNLNNPLSNDEDELENSLVSDNEEKIWCHYARSSSGSKEIIDSQFQKLQIAYGDAKFKINDKSSGLNEKRKGLSRIFELAKNKEITDIAVVREDRLARFGLKYIYEIFSQNNVNVHVLTNDKDKNTVSLEQEMMDDFMAIIASFSGRFSQMKSNKAKLNLLKQAEKRIKISTGEEQSSE
jgi:IS element ISTsi1 orfA, putative resolvase